MHIEDLAKCVRIQVILDLMLQDLSYNVKELLMLMLSLVKEHFQIIMIQKLKKYVYHKEYTTAIQLLQFQLQLMKLVMQFSIIKDIQYSTKKHDFTCSYCGW